MKLKLVLLSLVLPLFIISCSDDDNNVSPNSSNYYPMKSNNYWVYDYYSYDMQNNIQNDTYKKDSVVVAQQQNYMGKDAYLLNEFSDGVMANGTYFSYADKKLYAESKFILPSSDAGLMLPLDKITNEWAILADFDAASWNILTHQFANETIEFPGLPVAPTFSANYNVTGAKGTDVQMQIGGKTVNAKEIIVKHTVAGSLKILILSAPINFTITEKYYFVENIGLVKMVSESQTVSITIPTMGTQSIEVPGYEKTLVRYKIN